MHGMGKHCPARKAGTILAVVLLVVALTFAVPRLTDTSDARLAARLVVAQAQAERAEVDRQEVLDVLSGKLAMIEPIAGKEHFAMVANVKWQLVQEVK